MISHLSQPHTIVTISYMRCDDAMLLVRLDGIQSCAEVVSCVGICFNCEFVDCGGWTQAHRAGAALAPFHLRPLLHP